MILRSLEVDAAEFAAATGWDLKPEGACRGDVCVPLPTDARTAEGRVAVPVVAERLGMPVAAEPRHGLWALGPASVGGRALATAVAPDLALPDVEGRPFRLTSLRGRKVVVVAWASW